MEQKPKLEFELGKKYQIKLLFDSPKTGTNTNKDGKSYNWYLYGVEYNQIQYNFFADYDLHDVLKTYTNGDILEVIDNYVGDNPYGHDWSVSSVGSDKPLDQIMKNGQNKTDIIIGVWAAMKVASTISKDLDELKTNSFSVLEMHKQICKSVENEEELFND